MAFPQTIATAKAMGTYTRPPGAQGPRGSKEEACSGQMDAPAASSSPLGRHPTCTATSCWKRRSKILCLRGKLKKTRNKESGATSHPPPFSWQLAGFTPTKLGEGAKAVNGDARGGNSPQSQTGPHWPPAERFQPPEGLAHRNHRAMHLHPMRTQGSGCWGSQLGLQADERWSQGGGQEKEFEGIAFLPIDVTSWTPASGCTRVASQERGKGLWNVAKKVQWLEGQIQR